MNPFTKSILPLPQLFAYLSNNIQHNSSPSNFLPSSPFKPDEWPASISHLCSSQLWPRTPSVSSSSVLSVSGHHELNNCRSPVTSCPKVRVGEGRGDSEHAASSAGAKRGTRGLWDSGLGARRPRHLVRAGGAEPARPQRHDRHVRLRDRGQDDVHHQVQLIKMA